VRPTNAVSTPHPADDGSLSTSVHPDPGPHGRSRAEDPTPRCRVCIVIGTRPEAIKLAPVIAELERHDDHFELMVVTTAQHREMLAQALDVFGIHADVDLGMVYPRVTLGDFASRALAALSGCFEQLRPDLVVVQGDTNTVLAAVLAATYLEIPLAHVEAGLRSGDIQDPFPEELNRRLATLACDIHFAPTESARRNLLREGVPAERIVVTGNTIVDALRSIPRRATFDEPALGRIPWDRQRIILTTVHRREVYGEPLEEVCRALAELVARHADLRIVFPVHLNPSVRGVVFERLRDTPRIDLLPPLGYPDLLEVLRRSTLVLTDSGGIQEECPALGKPVLVLREKTERPEVIASGFGRLVGTSRRRIVAETTYLLEHPDALAAMVTGENPFGDGRAAWRIADALARRLPTRHAGDGAASPAPVPSCAPLVASR
jgi:UDP-N-acetylglucosamine 2-epimerase (non-hydrolysing)